MPKADAVFAIDGYEVSVGHLCRKAKPGSPESSETDPAFIFCEQRF